LGVSSLRKQGSCSGGRLIIETNFHGIPAFAGMTKNYRHPAACTAVSAIRL